MELGVSLTPLPALGTFFSYWANLFILDIKFQPSFIASFYVMLGDIPRKPVFFF